MTPRAYGFLDWSGDSGFKFEVGSSLYLSLCIVSSADYSQLRRGLIGLREQLGLPRHFEFHFARSSEVVRTVFFAGLPSLPWDASVLIVDKRHLPRDLRKMRDPSFYGFFVGHLLASAPLETMQVKRLLIDESEKQSALVRGIRIAVSPVLRARGIQHPPKTRGEPASRWDGLQVADMLAGAVVEREGGGKDYLQGLLGERLHVQRYRRPK